MGAYFSGGLVNYDGGGQQAEGDRSKGTGRDLSLLDADSDHFGVNDVLFFGFVSCPCKLR